MESIVICSKYFSIKSICIQWIDLIFNGSKQDLLESILFTTLYAVSEKFWILVDLGAKRMWRVI